MFSLAVSVIRAACLALALAALYYGGVAFNNSRGRDTHQSSVADRNCRLYFREAHGNGWPINLSDLPPNYLDTMPAPPANAYAEGAPKTTDWAYYLPGTTHHIVLSNKIRKDACMEVNRERKVSRVRENV